MDDMVLYPYVVRVSSEKMPASVKSPYKRIAVMETTDGNIPHEISTRPKNVVRVVRRWEKLFVGKTDKCAYRQALAEAEALCRFLNGETMGVPVKMSHLINPAIGK